MPLIPDLTDRRREREWMDDPELREDLHRDALDALARVNRLSLTGARVAREIERLHARGRRPIRVLDVACGGGDVLRDVARRMERAGIEVDLHGCDMSEAALGHARRRSRPEHAITYHRRDVVKAPLPNDFELVTSSLFLHHLSSDDAAMLLRRAAAAGQVVLVQDLRRTVAGYLLAFVALNTLTRSEVARVDGLRSVRAAFSVEEAKELSRRAGLAGATVRTCWPQRLTIRWQAP